MSTNLRRAVGQFAASTSSASQSVTTTDPNSGTFQPKVVIFFSGLSTVVTGTTTSSTIVGSAIGFSDGTNPRLACWNGAGGVGVTQTNSDDSDIRCIMVFDAANLGLSANQATISITSTGFTVNWVGGTPAAAYLVDYVALGGSDISNVAIGTGTMPTSTGNSSITGLGFQPNFVMLTSISNTLANTTVTNAHLSYGAAISSSARFAHAINVTNSASMSSSVNGVSIQRSDACLLGLTTAAAVAYVADFVSFDSGGFTLNFSTAPASAFVYFYLAIGGTNLNWDIGTAVKPTTAIAQSNTSIAFQPELVIWSNSDLTTLNSITSTAAISLGSCDGTTDECWYGTHNDAINTVAGTQTAATCVQDGAPANSSIHADFTSFNSNGWTITWNGTGSAHQISAISLAGTTASSGNITQTASDSNAATWAEALNTGFSMAMSDSETFNESPVNNLGQQVAVADQNIT